MPSKMRAAWIAALIWNAPALAAEIKPAVIYDLGGKFDKSFNEGVYNGAQAFTKQTGIEIRDFEPQNDSQREQSLRNFARRGQDPILAVGFSQAGAVTMVAKEFSKTRFVIIDSVVDAPNVQSILFREEEGSYLAGVLAVLKSQTDKIGFVGGMDVPLIRKFACGYTQGAKSVKPETEVLQNMTGTTGAAWNDPVRGGELAKSQIERGSDVVFQAAGATGVGVLQAAADAGKLGIGVDSNQNALHPGHVLTSVMKRVDVATQKAFTAAKDGTWHAGTTVLGLADDGVGLTFDQYNAPLVSETMKARVDAVRQDIISGKLKVHDYMTDGKCPV
jgi:basic membrane protein A and related proteins